jgi:hypothetical protein
MDVQDGAFKKDIINFHADPFAILSTVTEYEDVTKGKFTPLCCENIFNGMIVISFEFIFLDFLS